MKRWMIKAVVYSAIAAHSLAFLCAQQINLGTQVKGVLAPANGGTGVNSAALTGCPRISMGTWTFSPAYCSGGASSGTPGQIQVAGATTGTFATANATCVGNNCTIAGQLTVPTIVTSFIQGDSSGQICMNSSASQCGAPNTPQLIISSVNGIGIGNGAPVYFTGSFNRVNALGIATSTSGNFGSTLFQWATNYFDGSMHQECVYDGQAFIGSGTAPGSMLVFSSQTCPGTTLLDFELPVEVGSLVDAAIAPGTAPICANGAGGAFTTSGCTPPASSCSAGSLICTPYEQYDLGGGTYTAGQCVAFTPTTIAGTTAGSVAVWNYRFDPTTTSGWGAGQLQTFVNMLSAGSSYAIHVSVCNPTALTITSAEQVLNVRVIL